MKINSYPTVYHFRHKAVQRLFDGTIVIQEKIDGSQISFGVVEGELSIRSKGKQLILDNPEKMFQTAVDEIVKLAPNLKPNWIYRGEYLNKPKHNCLSYSRTPRHNIILYDVMIGMEEYLSVVEVISESQRLDLEVVPTYHNGPTNEMPNTVIEAFLEYTSILGGTLIEGVVIKNYEQFGRDKKILLGKYVSDAFKERNQKNWKKTNKGSLSILDELGRIYRCEGRWNKAIQHLAENGELVNAPNDIGILIREIVRDVEQECKDEILDLLWKWAWPQIKRKVGAGFPDWYKEKLNKTEVDEK